MKRKVTFNLLSLTLSFVFLFSFYHEVIIAPNDYIFSDRGDGIKNYYSYAWHVKHDTSYVHFEGMNYPYGEIHQFTDGQPFTANVVKFLSSFFPALEDHSIGLLNLLILLSFVLASWILSKILKIFDMPDWIAILGAIGIVGLSPQIFRMTGHISLSYYFSFPLLWYLLLKEDHWKKWRASIGIFFLNFIILFVHPYLSVINISFLLLFHLFEWLRIKKPTGWMLSLKIFIQAGLPIILWKLYLLVFDHHLNRAEDVFYMTGITANLKSILLPPFGWLNQTLNQHLMRIHLPWEGWAYLGIPGVCLFILLPFLLTYSKYKNNTWWIPGTSGNSVWKSTFWAAFVILLFSFGYPYRLGMEFLVDWFPFLKQIRALGRFAWVFFYVFNVFSLVLIWKWINRRQWKPWVKVMGMSFVLGILLLEASFYHLPQSKVLSSKANFFKESEFQVFKDWRGDWHERINPENYQAIVPLSFFHIGGAAYSYEASGHQNLRPAMTLSYHSRIPLAASAMARSSETESRAQIQFWTFPWVEKPHWYSLQDTVKPFLLYKCSDDLSTSERYWWEHADTVWCNEDILLKEIKPGKLLKFDRKEFLEWIEADTIPKGFSQMKMRTPFWYDPDYTDTLATPQTWEKERSRTAKMRGYNTLYEGYESWFKPGQEIDISFWYRNDPRMAHSAAFIVAEIENGKEKWTKVSSMRNTKHFVNNWSRMEYLFRIGEQTQKIKIFLHSGTRYDTDIYWRDIFLWNAESDLIFENPDGMIFWNNYRIPGQANAFNTR